jgi:siroheme synthase (precorrin-2 oxidase/ferrochelatase)
MKGRTGNYYLCLQQLKTNGAEPDTALRILSVMEAHLPDLDEQASRALELRHRAEQLRAVAEALKDPECYAALMRIAASYDVMAQGAEHTLEAAESRAALAQAAPGG